MMYVHERERAGDHDQERGREGKYDSLFAACGIWNMEYTRLYYIIYICVCVCVIEIARVLLCGFIHVAFLYNIIVMVMVVLPCQL